MPMMLVVVVNQLRSARRSVLASWKRAKYKSENCLLLPGLLQILSARDRWAES
jgi:hypothetical protein